MQHFLISTDLSLGDRWKAAFPKGRVTTSLKQALRVAKKTAPFYWLDRRLLQATDELEIVETFGMRGKLVLLSPKPGQVEASKYIRAGAMGYCHVGSPANKFREVAVVLENEGFWMPKEMIQRITQVTRRFGSKKFNPDQDPNELTHRERAVAELVGLGANNAEIARKLNMSERTVKSHLTSVFQQLKVRDRVHLALVMNRLPIGQEIDH
jgi:DNA-binding NarL/FixJ family response regulator